MKKVLILIVIIVLIIIIVMVALLMLVSKMQSAPKEYWNNIKSDSEIETKYNKLGKYGVGTKKYNALKDERDEEDNFFQVWYPEENGIYPLVIMVNGTGVPCNKYEAVFEHFASWGYVIIGNNYGTNWDGKHPSESLDFALKTKEIANIIDVNKIAIGGHSQGGMGTFNAVTEYDNGNRYKAIFSLSPTNRTLGISLQWGFNLDTENSYAYKLDEIKIPTILVAGTGPFDNDTVSPLEEMEKAYNELNTDRIMFRRSNNIDHANMLYEANGYIIAWLDYYLKDIEENKKAFFGENAEIKNNTRYQDFKSEELESDR